MFKCCTLISINRISEIQMNETFLSSLLRTYTKFTSCCARKKFSTPHTTTIFFKTKRKQTNWLYFQHNYRRMDNTPDEIESTTSLFIFFWFSWITIHSLFCIRFAYNCTAWSTSSTGTKLSSYNSINLTLNRGTLLPAYHYNAIRFPKLLKMSYIKKKIWILKKM